MGKYKYLLWDIDGTVLNFLASEAYALKTTYKKYQLGTCSDEMLQMYSRINIKYWEALERNEMTKPEILTGRFKTFFDTLGIDSTIAEKFNRDYEMTLCEHVTFEKHAHEMLQACKEKYTQIAVTNGTKIVQTRKLKESGLDQIFDAVFISEDVGVDKPNAAYFEYVFKNTGIKEPSKVLLIGDSLTSDMRGGQTAGIDTCWYNPKKIENDHKIPVTYEVDDLGKLARIL